MKHSNLRKTKVPNLELCGTTTGYENHLRRSEWPCERCLVGSRTYTEDEIRELIRVQYDRDRDQQLWNTYRLSLDRFAKIFELQGKRCGCCGAETHGDGTWHVDHDHETRLIRGILCPKCNTGISQLGDDLPGVLRAVTYLQGHHARGGHVLAEAPPPPRTPPPISAVMERCFTCFQQELTTSQIVILLRLEPAFVEELRELWKSRGGTPVTPKARHVFQLSQDPPSCLCSCGHTVPCDPKDLDSVLAATEEMNEHIKKGNSTSENWTAMQLEETARRKEESARQLEDLHRSKEETLRRAREDAQHRALIREQEQEGKKERRSLRKTRNRWKAYEKSTSRR